MNKEIKFRKWAMHTDGKMGMVDWTIIQGGSVHNLLSCDEGEALMQFTGLKDVDNKDIYEGDIVTHNSLDPVQVFFSCGGYEPFSFASDHNGRNYKVIGNIYENKDLIS